MSQGLDDVIDTASACFIPVIHLTVPESWPPAPHPRGGTSSCPAPSAAEAYSSILRARPAPRLRQLTEPVSSGDSARSTRVRYPVLVKQADDEAGQRPSGAARLTGRTWQGCAEMNVGLSLRPSPRTSGVEPLGDEFRCLARGCPRRLWRGRRGGDCRARCTA